MEERKWKKKKRERTEEKGRGGVDPTTDNWRWSRDLTSKLFSPIIFA